MTAKGAARRVAAPADGIRVPSSLLDQVIVEQPDDDKALLQGSIGQARSRVDGHDRRPAWIRPAHSNLELTRFRGHISSEEEEGVHDAKDTPTIFS